MASLPSVSVIVPVHNAVRGLPRLFASLRAQTYPRERVEWILVDNNSRDGSAEIIKTQPGATYLSQTRWQGPAATRNVGIEHAKGDVCAFIDADCWADSAWLATGVHALMEQKVDRIAGRVEFVLSAYPNIYEIYDSTVNFQQTDFISRGWSGTGNLFVRREIFSQVGLLEPCLLSCEDREWGLRATAAGKTLAYAPHAIVYHRARTSLISPAQKKVSRATTSCSLAIIYMIARNTSPVWKQSA